MMDDTELERLHSVATTAAAADQNVTIHGQALLGIIRDLRAHRTVTAQVLASLKNAHELTCRSNEQLAAGNRMIRRSMHLLALVVGAYTLVEFVIGVLGAWKGRP